MGGLQGIWQRLKSLPKFTAEALIHFAIISGLFLKIIESIDTGYGTKTNWTLDLVIAWPLNRSDTITNQGSPRAHNY